jgi:hypothetical protein
MLLSANVLFSQTLLSNALLSASHNLLPCSAHDQRSRELSDELRMFLRHTLLSVISPGSVGVYQYVSVSVCQ